MWSSRRLALVAISVALAGCQPAVDEWTPLAAPIPAPDFTLPRLGGGSVRLGGLRGQIVIMEFWATWCGPCRFSTPSLDVIYRKFRDRGVAVLLINQGEPEQQVEAWVEHRFAAPILLDLDASVGATYQARGIPKLFLVDPDGQIRYIRSGYGGGLERSLTRILEAMLAAPAEEIS